MTLFSFEQHTPTCSGKVIKGIPVIQWKRWWRQPGPIGPSLPRTVPDEPVPARQCGVYQPLYKYLQNRYATTVVLKFSEIEDILGFALPAIARTDREWWTVVNSNTAVGAYGGAWMSAKRTAAPNFLAGTVVFERRA